MKSKQELITTIASLPKFELRDVASNKEEWHQDARQKAVVEIEDAQHNILTLVSQKYNLMQFEEVYNKIIEEIESFLEEAHKTFDTMIESLKHFDIKLEKFKNSIATFLILDELKEKNE